MNFVTCTATERTVSRQTGKLKTLRLLVFDFRSVPFQLFQSHKCFIDSSKYILRFFVTHNQCTTINVLNSKCNGVFT